MAVSKVKAEGESMKGNCLSTPATGWILELSGEVMLVLRRRGDGDQACNDQKQLAWPSRRKPKGMMLGPVELPAATFYTDTC